MNDETIFDSNPIGESRENNNDSQNFGATKMSAEKDTEALAKKKKNNGLKFAGIAGAAGLAGAAAGVFMPKDMFASEENVDDVDSADGGAGTSAGGYEGHELQVATGVDDSMSFAEAFAAAREEVGPGGLFEWHGQTYGTYYQDEWQNMSPEEQGEYWASVNQTTSALNEQDPSEVPPENIAEVPPIEPEVISDEEQGSYDPEPIGSSEPDPQDDSIVITVNESDVYSQADTNGDGMVNASIIDFNGNDIPDIVLDASGDGVADTLIIDPSLNENGEFIGDAINIDGMSVESDDSGIVFDPIEDPTMEEPDPGIINSDEIPEDIPNIDDTAMATIDPDIPIDNDMNMSEYI